MIQLLMSMLGAVALFGGIAMVAMLGRDRVQLLRGRGLDPHCLEVLARVGLHTNQGLAVVRVGRRLLLVSCGEGGARTLTELTEEDLAAEVTTPRPDPIPQPRFRLPQMPRRAQAWRGLGVGLAVTVSLLADTNDARTQQVVPPASAVVAEPGSLGSIFDALPPVRVQVGDEEEGLRLNGTVGTIIVLGLLTIAPTLLLLTTSFTRILVVLHLLRQALGTQNSPPGHLLAGLALLLSAVVMAPTLDAVRVAAVDPWLAGEIDEAAMMSIAVVPMRSFMLSHTRDVDLRTFLQVSRSAPPTTEADIPNVVLMSAFVTSELRAAFEIGFAVFLPFIVIDIVVAAVLTSMGMFMLPPTMIALPCKLMLFVLMDGWSLLLGTLVQSFV